MSKPEEHFETCLICSKTCDIPDTKICGMSECEKHARSIFTGDNYIYDLVKKQRDESVFLLTLARETLNPTNKRVDLIQKAYPEIDLDVFMKLLQTVKPRTIIKHIKKLGSDKAFYDEDNNLYAVIKWVLSSNLLRFKLRYRDNLTTGGKTPKILRVRVFNVINFDDDSIKPPDPSMFVSLAHGSNTTNWYSIITTGLQSMSNTKYMSHAAAYGSGMYMSDSVDLAKSYATTGKTGLFILGVYDIPKELALKCKKTTNIFVIPQSPEIKLKKLIVVEDGTPNGKLLIELSGVKPFSSGSITSTDQTKVATFAKKSSITPSSKTLKRLKKEVKLCMDARFHVSVSEENFLIWNVSIPIDMFPKDESLYKDMIANDISTINFELRFSPTYPGFAPFLRVTNPIFKQQTGHITIGGCVCMDMLTSDGWSPINKVTTIMTTVISVLSDGKARLDVTKSRSKEYTYYEAQLAFARLRRAHGW